MSTKLKPGTDPAAILNGRWHGACMVVQHQAGVKLCGFRDNFKTEAGAKRYLGWYHRVVNRMIGIVSPANGPQPSYLMLELEVKVVSVKPWSPT